MNASHASYKELLNEACVLKNIFYRSWSKRSLYNRLKKLS